MDSVSPLFLAVRVGDVVAVAPPRQQVFLAQVISWEGGARTAEPSLLQVLREDDLAVITVNAEWVIDRLASRLV